MLPEHLAPARSTRCPVGLLEVGSIFGPVPAEVHPGASRDRAEFGGPGSL